MIATVRNNTIVHHRKKIDMTDEGFRLLNWNSNNYELYIMFDVLRDKMQPDHI